MTRSQLLRAHRAQLPLFLSMADATIVEEAVEATTEPDCKVIDRLMKSSLVGAELFAPESAVLELNTYVSEIERRLYDLEMS